MEVSRSTLQFHIANKPVAPKRDGRFFCKFIVNNFQNLLDGTNCTTVTTQMATQGFVPCMPDQLSASDVTFEFELNEQDEMYFIVYIKTNLKRTEEAYKALYDKYVADLQKWKKWNDDCGLQLIALFQEEVNALAEKYGFQDADMTRQKQSK